MGNAGQANYSKSKAGVIGLTKKWQGNWRRGDHPWQMRVAPGFIETDMTDAMTESAKEAVQNRFRWGDAEIQRMWQNL